jgi:hypothetical protein
MNGRPTRPPPAIGDMFAIPTQALFDKRLSHQTFRFLAYCCWTLASRGRLPTLQETRQTLDMTEGAVCWHWELLRQSGWSWTIRDFRSEIVDGVASELSAPIAPQPEGTRLPVAPRPKGTVPR